MRFAGALLIALCATLTPIPIYASDWVANGLIWQPPPPPPPPPPPVVNSKRVQEQIEQGCTATDVKFADTALMRGSFALAGKWPPQTRNFVIAATISDDLDLALNFLDQALETKGLDTTQIEVLKNHRVLSALLFGDFARAGAILGTLDTHSGLPKGLLADRIFWRALVAAQNSRKDVKKWRTAIRPSIEEAAKLDPNAFIIRVWRLIAWLEAESWKQEKSCVSSAKKFSALVLDVSKASACPLLIGHVSHAMDRHFRARADGNTPPASSLAAWRRFAVGVLATVSQEHQTSTAAAQSLIQADGIPCAPTLGNGIINLRLELGAG